MMTDKTQSNQEQTETRKRFLSTGLLIGAATNAVGFAAGAVFFTSDYGGKFRGMEPEARVI